MSLLDILQAVKSKRLPFLQKAINLEIHYYLFHFLTSDHSHPLLSAKMVWISYVPLKVLDSCQKPCSNELILQIIFKRLTLSGEYRLICVLCAVTSGETASHLLIHCSLFLRFLDKAFETASPSSVLLDNIYDCLTQWYVVCIPKKKKLLGRRGFMSLFGVLG